MQINRAFISQVILKCYKTSVIRQEVSLVLRILAFRGTFLAVTEQPLAVFILEDALDSLISWASDVSEPPTETGSKHYASQDGDLSQIFKLVKG